MAGRDNKLLIRGGRVIDPANGVDKRADVCIANGRILSVGRRPDGFFPDREISIPGQIVCPGLIELSARLREPGAEHKATIASETEAAASAGITTLCCPPDTDPIIDTPAVVELIRRRAIQSGRAQVLTLGALTQGLAGEQLSEMAALKRAGCVGVSNAYYPVRDARVMRRAMEYAATFGLTVFLHPEDASLRDRGCAHEGAVSARLGLPPIAEAAETVAVARDLALIAQIGVRAHFCRLSSARAAAMIELARQDGLPVSADCAVHHLHLTEDAIGEFDSRCHVRPPLRAAADRDGLRRALAGGALSALCCDHQPHEDGAKLAPFPASAPGVSGLETLLPLALRLEDPDDFSLTEIIARLTCGPAGVLGINAGALSPNAQAGPVHFRSTTEVDPGRRKDGQPGPQHPLRRLEPERPSKPHDFRRAGGVRVVRLTPSSNKTDRSYRSRTAAAPITTFCGLARFRYRIWISA